jgi:hypothetical protein
MHQDLKKLIIRAFTYQRGIRDTRAPAVGYGRVWFWQLRIFRYGYLH